jgi:uncharacterized protein (TIGR01777 family)
MATYLITGGTGLVGKALTDRLIDSGHSVIILSRKPAVYSNTSLLQHCYWDPNKSEIDEEAIRKADYIIHLAGANVAEKRWSEKRKKEIVDSRVISGQFLSASLKRIPHRVKAVLGASAQGWYGADPMTPNPAPFMETDPVYPDFLGTTCRLWEESLQPIKEAGIRLIQLRIGIVLSTKGGALAEFRKPVRFGIIPILGSGKQIISWIHIQDLVSMILWSLESETVSGIYNAAAPHPVSNFHLMKALAKASSRLFIPIPVPSFVLKILLGEMSIEVLKSTTISAQKIQGMGFHFRYEKIEEAMRDLIGA